MDIKKVLIVSASIGAGHNQAAYAVAKTLKKNHQHLTVDVVDFMAPKNSPFNTIVKEAYLKLIDISPEIYDRIYRWSQPNQTNPKVQNIVANMMKWSMLNLYHQYQPDMIVFTHPFPCGAAAYLRRTGKINIPLAAIITDFSIHQFWVYKEIDLYFVAGQELQEELIKRNIPSDKIHPFGIPIDESFAFRPEKNAIARKFKVNVAVPILLLMAGGLGIGPVAEILNSLETCSQNLQIIVVTGKNIALYQELTQKARVSRHRITIIGYTKRIRELMVIADILITKPGALTISEALAMSLPMVLFNQVSGQEDDNAHFLLAQGAAKLVDKNTSFLEIVTLLLSQPELLKAMQLSAAKLGKPHATQAVVGTITSYLAIPGKRAAG